MADIPSSAPGEDIQSEAECESAELTEREANARAAGHAEKTAWFVTYSKAVISVIVVLTLVGAFMALSIPIAVFPTTNFPRVLIAIDNGVMPIDQMLVTITRPIEEAVNSVQGLQTVRSITSRGTAEVDLFFDWKVDMFQTLQRVNAAMSAVQGSLPPTAALFKFSYSWIRADLQHDARDPIVGSGDIRHEATPEPREWRRYGARPRRRRAGV
jgi:AcrB/AcrD/AcrF family